MSAVPEIGHFNWRPIPDGNGNGEVSAPRGVGWCWYLLSELRSQESATSALFENRVSMELPQDLRLE